MYAINPNSILSEPLKNKSESEQLGATKELQECIKERGLPLKVQILDNKCPQAIKNHSIEQEIMLELAPPFVHRTNAAESTIKIIRDHFISGLCSMYSTYTMYLWCRLIPLATKTINLLILERINPRILD